MSLNKERLFKKINYRIEIKIKLRIEISGYKYHFAAFMTVLGR